MAKFGPMEKYGDAGWVLGRQPDGTPNVVYRGAFGPHTTRYSNAAWEAERQAVYTSAVVGDNGEHYRTVNAYGKPVTTPSTISLEECERQDDLRYDGKAHYKGDPLGGFLSFLKIAWQSIWHMGMYSQDPYLARIAVVHTAREQIGVQRQIHTQERAVDHAQDEARMRQMAQIMAQEFVKAAREMQP